MHESGGADDFCAEDIGHALVSEAHAEYGHLFAEVFDDFAGQTGFAGAAGAGRDDDSGGFEGFDLLEGDLVVAFDADFGGGVNFADALHEVEREGVVVIEQEDHCVWPCGGAAAGQCRMGHSSDLTCGSVWQDSRKPSGSELKAWALEAVSGEIGSGEGCH